MTTNIKPISTDDYIKKAKKSIDSALELAQCDQNASSTEVAVAGTVIAVHTDLLLQILMALHSIADQLNSLSKSLVAERN